MKRKILILIGALLVVSFVRAGDLEVGESAYAIRDGVALREEKDPDAKTVTQLKTHKAYKVVQLSGKWAQLKTDVGIGWVFGANLSREEPPDVNSSGFQTQASGTTVNAAARGLSDDAKGHASRKGAGDSANDVEWMEKQNDLITLDQVKAFLKEHKLGEY